MNAAMLDTAPKAGPTPSPKRLARIAGSLYLIVAVFGGFAEFGVRAKVYVPASATATAHSVLANAGLVRVGVVADLVQSTAFVFLALVLHQLLKSVSPNLARAMVVLVSIAAGIICLNLVFEFASMLVATNSAYATALGAGGSDALVLLLLTLQHYGYLIAQIFFGLWLVPLGLMAYRSGMFPRALGVTLIVGGACYLVDMLALFLFPGVGAAIHAYIVIPSTIAELWMMVYLLVKGVRSAPARAVAA